MAEENLDSLFENERVSVPLTQKNAKFRRSEGGLISLDLKTEEKNEAGETVPKNEFFERIVIFRCFPVTNQTNFCQSESPIPKRWAEEKKSE